MTKNITSFQTGDWIYIEKMPDAPHYNHRCGQITYIDDMMQLHGTWGGLAVNLDVDTVVKIPPLN